MIANDKLIHFLGGLVIALLAGLFLDAWIGLAAAVVVGIGKELVDRMGFGTVDKWDAVATIVGGLLGFILILISEAL